MNAESVLLRLGALPALPAQHMYWGCSASGNLTYSQHPASMSACVLSECFLQWQSILAINITDGPQCTQLMVTQHQQHGC